MKATWPTQDEIPGKSFGNETYASTPWRPIHYLGSKLRALSSVEQAVNTLAAPGERVYDLFAGSGTVARWLARSRPVTSVDVQEYSRVICSAMLNPVRIDIAKVEKSLTDVISISSQSGSLFVAEPLIELEIEAMDHAAKGDLGLLADLLDAGSILTNAALSSNSAVKTAFREARRRLDIFTSAPATTTMALRHFGGLYFSFRQAAEIDTILSLAHSRSDNQKDVLLAAALSCASELVNTIGKQFAQPIRPRNKDGVIKRGLYGQVARDRLLIASEVYISCLSKYASLPTLHQPSFALRSDYLDFLSSANFDGGVVYADPPYTRDHYSRFYHVLETMSLFDDPQISSNTAKGKTNLSRGAYRAERHQSPFCIKSQAPAAFDHMFSLVSRHGSSIIVSYSPYSVEKNAHPRVMTMDGITEIASRHYADVGVLSVGDFSHSRLNRVGLSKEIGKEAELLIVCRSPR